MQLKEGDIFDRRYRLTRKLGSGGFSEVWLAEDKQINSLEVSLKIYTPEQVEPGEVDNFIRKFELVYNLNHHNLLPPNACGEFRGMLYLVMRYCERGSTAKLTGNISEDESWHFLHDVAAGLEYLHQKNIIHQDIKPDNVLIAQDDTYIITDFDISTKAHVTRRMKGDDNPAGTAGYMAPERFGSAATLPIQASDIWALGASLFELLTGNLPFGDMGGLTQKSGVNIPYVGATLARAKNISPLQQIITLCLQPEAWNRPTAKEIQTWCEQYFQKGKIHLDDKYRKIINPPKTINKKTFRKIGIVIVAIIGLTGVVAVAPIVVGGIQTEWNNYQETKAAEAAAEKKAAAESMKKAEAERIEREQKEREAAAAKAVADKIEKEKQAQQQAQQQASEQQAQVQTQTQITDLLSQANKAFNNAQYDEAFNLYLKAKNLGSSDKTGYNKFEGKAKELIDILGEDDEDVKELLFKSQQLK